MKSILEASHRLKDLVYSLFGLIFDELLCNATLKVIAIV